MGCLHILCARKKDATTFGYLVLGDRFAAIVLSLIYWIPTGSR